MVRGGIMLLAAMTIITVSAWGRGESWMPTERHYQAAEGGRECSILRGVKLQEEERLIQSRSAKEEEIAQLKERRAELEKCAEQRGLKAGEQGVGDESLLAEVCPANYKNWLQPGYRLQFIKADIQEAKQAISLIDSHIKSSCRPLALNPPAIAPVVREEKVAILPEDQY